MLYARIKRSKYSLYAFDIETHNDEESIAKKETSMWLGSLINDENTADDESSYVYSMDEFLDRLDEMSSVHRHHANESRPCKNICIYIYNASFEWSFILPVLLKRGFEYKEFFTKEDEFVFNSISTRSVSSVWVANIKFHKNSGNIIIKDLAKMYGGGLGAVAKSFNLPTQKGEIDYRLNRLHNHIVTKEEKEYCFKDTRIIIDILINRLEADDKDFFNSSSSSSYAMRKLLKAGWPYSFKPYKEFRKMYPFLYGKEQEMLREGTSGGLTQVNRLFQFKDIKQKILHIDAHQMHPSQGYSKRFPYGRGTYFRGKPKDLTKVHLCKIKVSYDDCKFHSIIKLIGIPFITDYELVVWSFEIPTMYKCYENLQIKYIEGYSYDTCRLPWRKFYANNYRERLKAKKAKDSFGTLYWKLLNNGSYGKLLEKPHNEIFINTIDDFGIITSNVVEKNLSDNIEKTKNRMKGKSKEEVDEAVKQTKLKWENSKFTYLPVGSAIPAYSRICLIELALKFGLEKVVYCDTDSLFILYDEETQKVWDSVPQEDFLCNWGFEEMIDRSQYTAPKRYKLEVNGKLDVKMAGVNFDPNLSFDYDELNIIDSSWEVQRAFRCKGGTLIDFQRKDISIQDKYKEIAKKNIN